MTTATDPHLGETPRSRTLLQAAMLLALAVGGLAYVKWLPYWHKGFAAAAHHSIGASILTAGARAPPAPSLQAAISYALAYGKAIWQALVLGLLLGSGVQALLPAEWVARVLGRRSFGSALAGGLLALPGMMCTCCAAPVVAGLRRSRAASGAAIAFWLGNSVLNPATLVFMGFVLGWQWSALRLVLGAAMVFGLGWLAGRIAPEEADAAPLPVAAEPAGNPFVRWARLLVQMTLRLLPEYLILVLLLGAVRGWIFPALGPDVAANFAWVAVFALAGMVFVIPTAGEVPIIQAVLSLGVGAGAAGALLMTLPPVSAPSLAMLARAFPPRVLLMVAAGVVVFGIAGGAAALALGF